MLVKWRSPKAKDGRRRRLLEVVATDPFKLCSSQYVDHRLNVDNLGAQPPRNLAALLARFPNVITVEAHSLDGGLGSLVCEVVAEQGLDCRVVRRGVSALEPSLSGSQAYLEDHYGLSAGKLAATAAEVFQKA